MIGLLFSFEQAGGKTLVPLRLKPLGLGAPSEVTFVRDLEAFYNLVEGKEAIGQRILYLLRNAASADKGLGFVLAGEAPLVLNAFVLLPTKYSDLLNVGDPIRKAELESRNVLFMEDGSSTYLKKLFSTLI
ncbi:TPA: hypothetical protein ACKRKP_003442 [Proteus mirabilis]